MADDMRCPTCAVCQRGVDEVDCIRVGDKVLWRFACHGCVELVAFPPTLTAQELEDAMKMAFVRPSVLFEDRT